MKIVWQNKWENIREINGIRFLPLYSILIVFKKILKNISCHRHSERFILRRNFFRLEGLKTRGQNRIRYLSRHHWVHDIFRSFLMQAFLPEMNIGIKQSKSWNLTTSKTINTWAQLLIKAISHKIKNSIKYELLKQFIFFHQLFSLWNLKPFLSCLLLHMCKISAW